jgi:deoxyguanosine kinase
MTHAPAPLTATAQLGSKPPVRHLAVEGPIGAGKTTLAQLLAERWSARALLERPQDNPFLERFYRDMPRYALPTQLSFLMQRAQQTREIETARLQDTALVTDFVTEKNDVFARLTLPEDEWQLYRTLAASLAHASKAAQPESTPDLVVYLQASPEALYARIQKRGVPMEQMISDSYLRNLCRAYDEFFYHYDRAPVLTVSAEHLNPLDTPEDLALLVERIETMRGRKASFVKGAAR